MVESPGFSDEVDEAPSAKPLQQATSHRRGLKARFPLIRQRQSLVGRLAKTYLLTTLLILIGLSAAIYLFTDVYLDRQSETELAAQADFYAAYAASLALDERSLAGLAPTIVDLFAPQADLTVRFFAGSDGRLLAATQDIGLQPSRAALTELRYRSPAVFTQPSSDLPHRRYAARPVVVGDRAVGVVEVSRSTVVSDQFLTSLRTILLVAILVSVVLSLLVGGILARGLSGPVRDMERVTRRIAAGDLDARLGSYPRDEMGQLAQSINHMAVRLKQLESARAQFISEVSHDLRTPLTAIKGLLVNLIDDSEPTERASLEIAERETDRLIRLVNQLLDFSRWQGGRLELKRQFVDVGDIARDAVGLSAGRAHHRNVGLTAEIPRDLPMVSADPDRLQRVILNLLDNGIKFTPRGGQVTLTATRKGGEIEISVQDTGPGMSDEARARAFEPYYRGEGGGVGLGLTIARATVEAHGGRMDIESGETQGSRVWFTLPL